LFELQLVCRTQLLTPMPFRSPDDCVKCSTISVFFFSGETVAVSGLKEEVTVADLCARLERLRPLDSNKSGGYQLVDGAQPLDHHSVLPTTLDTVSAMVIPPLVQGAYVHWAGEDLRKDGTTLTKGMRGVIVRGGGSEWTVKFPGMGMLRNAPQKSLRPLCRSEMNELFPAAVGAEVPEKQAEVSFLRDRLLELVVAAQAAGADEESLEPVRSRLAEVEASFGAPIPSARARNPLF